MLEEIPADWERHLAALACVAIDADYRALDATLVGAAHRAGYRVLTYTPNDPAVVARLREWRVDAIITDAIDRVGP